MIESADPEDASQAAHVERLQTIDIGLEQGPCFSAVQEGRQDARLVQVEFYNKTQVPLSPSSTELIHGRCRESDTAHDLGCAVSIGGDLAAKVNEFIGIL